MHLQRTSVGNYSVIVDIPKNYPKPVKARSISQTFRKKKDAMQWGRDTEAAIRKGEWEDPRIEKEPEPVPEEKWFPTLWQVLNGYHKIETNYKKGWRQERTLIKRFMNNYEWLVSKKINHITSGHIAEYIVERQRAGCKPSTIRNEVNTLSAVYGNIQNKPEFAEVENPVKKLRAEKRHRGGIPRPSSPRERRFRNGEERAIRRELAVGLDGQEMLALLELALSTGARMGELLSFRRSWRIEPDVIRVPDTKNGSERNVVLSSVAQSALDALDELPRRRRGSGLDEYFSLSVHNAEYRWSEARKRAAKDLSGIKDLRFHDMRHEALTRMSLAGWGLRVLMRQSGHSSVAQLMRYVNPNDDDVRKLMRKHEVAHAGEFIEGAT
ncbi:tyrosine-type recombinase/integrase [Fodinicurvata fenggangensis]|uniref:tyrosine-type recombinase/integrase n=1 Tax=Fodinicurvata fenggangensis TaxID=1121830 RepID=UPI00047C019A|nr:integrase [Fodinicurvata fenggangensis]